MLIIKVLIFPISVTTIISIMNMYLFCNQKYFKALLDGFQELKNYDRINVWEVGIKI